MTEPLVWTPGRIWEGRTVAILASGPSLTREDADAVHRSGVPSIAINTTYKLAPWATVLYACDAKWWDWHGGASEFAGLRVTQDPIAALRWSLHYVRGAGASGLSTRPGRVHLGQNGGYQALNLAVLLGARRIVLLGYDMRPAPDGREHWHADHPDAVRSDRRPWLVHFQRADRDLQRLGVEVVNCTPGSALTCFPRDTLAWALQG